MKPYKNVLVTAVLLLVNFYYALGDPPAPTRYNIGYYDIVWSNQTTAFILSDSGLYRSLDEGITWTAAPGVSDYIIFYAQDQVDSNKLLFVGVTDRTKAWRTVDGGLTYTIATFPWKGAPFGFSTHPSKSGWLFSYVVTDSVNRMFTLYVSQDFGITWNGPLQAGKSTLICLDASWGDDSSTPGVLFVITNDFTFEYTSDFGKSYTKLYDGAFGFAMTQHHLFVAVDDTRNTNEANLMVSSGAYTDVKSYAEAQFPFGEDLAVSSFTFLDDTTGAEWLGVGIHNQDWGTIYTSGVHGLKYTTTLDHAYDKDGMFDFDIFHGLEGIYVVNVVANPDQKDPKLRTQITFDNGGSWQYLAVPAADKATCSGECRLHLNGLNSWAGENGLPPYYSSPNAIGLLLATGNLGESLSKSPSSTNTYFSRDAGLTWIKILDGPHIYEIADHGSIIVFAPTDVATNQIMYSLDEGQTLPLPTITLPGSAVTVENIIAEPSGTGLKFIVYGDDQYGSGVIFGLDFSHVHNRTCGASDYEDWAPNGGGCLLGRNVTYSRRKTTSLCYNSRSIEVLKSSVNCSCSKSDYECDFGYDAHLINGGPDYDCVLSTVNPPEDPPKNCEPGKTYERSTGYRKVAGDSCVKDLPAFAPEIKNCPAKKGGSSHSGIIAAVIIVILVAFGFVGFLIYRNEEWREKVLGVIGKVIPLGASGSSRYSRLGGARGGSLADEEFGIGSEHDLDDSDVEEDAPVLHDNDIMQATSTDKRTTVDFDALKS